MKAQGCNFPSSPLCDRMAPTPTSEASTSTTKGLSGSGIKRMGAEVKRCLSSSKGPTASRTAENLNSSSLGQCSQGSHHRPEVHNESPIEVCAADEMLNLLNCGGNRPVEDSFNLLRVHFPVARSDETPRN